MLINYWSHRLLLRLGRLRLQWEGKRRRMMMPTGIATKTKSCWTLAVPS